MLQAEQVLHNRYQLKDKLGQNAGRQTWLADDLHSNTHELVIVKLLAFGGEVQWDDLKLFEREAQVLKQLDHPRIPKYRDYFSVDERSLWFGLVQDYIPGTCLKALLNQGKRFTEQQVRQIAIDILQILIYLHQLSPPLLHRDIKPSNLIWGEDNQIYLVDFGAVQDRAAQEGATFTVVGTYGYAPMEQFGGRAVPASDLYALGATLIHLLTGTAPADLPQDDIRIQFSDRVALDSDLVRWIEKLIEPSLKRRFSTAQQALTALQSNSLVNSDTQNSTDSDLVYSSGSGKIRPPEGTRVRMKKVREKLQILVPERRQNGQEGLLLLGSCLTFLVASILWLVFQVGTPLIALLFLGVSPLMFLKITRFYYQSTHVAFSRNMNRFEIEWRWFGHTVTRYKGAISQISYTCCHSGRGGSRVLITGIVPYSFGHGLTEVECAWLAQEIQTWLHFT